MSESAWEKRCLRERRAREAAEALLESKSLELYHANQETQILNTNLEKRVRERVEELAEANERLIREDRDRRMAQEKLRVTQFVVDRSADAIYWIDPQANFVYVNDAACHAVGYSREELLQMNVFDIDVDLPPEAWPGHWEELRRRGSFTLESTHCSKQGRPFPVEVTVNYIQMGDVEYNCVYARDITDRMESKLRSERLTELHEIVEEITLTLLQSQDLTASINLILRKVGRFLDVSRSYLMRFREGEQMVYTTHEWTAEGFPSQADRFQDIPVSEYGWWIEQLSLGKPIVINDLEKVDWPERIGNALSKHQTRAFLALPIIINGTLTGMLGFDQASHARQWLDEDITLILTIADSLSRAVERQIADREREHHRLELSESLQRETEANKAKSSFLANMSHEIRTPMTAILGYAEMLTRDNRSREEQHEWAEQTRRSAEHLLGLLNDILDLSKIEAGELTISRESFNLEDILNDVKSLLDPFADEKLIKLCVNKSDTSSSVLFSDPTRVRQILINLIHNAIKFTDSGEIKVVVFCESLEEDDTDWLKIAVSDTGTGIPENKINEIFRPFSQVKHNSKRTTGGVGLGLTISRHLAQMLGGNLAAKNLDTGGSQFTLTLPLTTQVSDPYDLSQVSHVSRETNREQSQISLENMNILVVDDNPDNQRIIRFLLEEVDANVTAAMNGQEGVDLILNSKNHVPFDAVLMDIQMPVMDGYTATEHIRQEGISIPIIALTAHAMSEDKERCLASGCDDYVSKPIIPDQFYRCLVKHIQNRTLSKRTTETTAPMTKPKPEPQTKSNADIGSEPIVSTMAGNLKFAPILEMYLVSLTETRALIRTQLQAKDWNAIRDTAHRIRGTAGNHGFPQITEAAGQCEDLIRTHGSAEDIAQSTHQLLNLLDAVATDY